MIDWRTDIENAPRNGTKILAHDSRLMRTDVVKWDLINPEKHKHKDWVMPYTWDSCDSCDSCDDPLDIFNSFDFWAEINTPKKYYDLEKAQQMMAQGLKPRL